MNGSKEGEGGGGGGGGRVGGTAMFCVLPPQCMSCERDGGARPGFVSVSTDDR